MKNNVAEIAGKGSPSNTKTPLADAKKKEKKEPWRSRRWFGTINNYTDKDIELVSLYFKEFIYGKEIAPTTGTRHLHVFGRLKNERTWETVREDLPRVSDLKMITGKTENDKYPIEYCMKDDWAGYETNMPKYKRKISKLEGKTLYPWQQEIMNIINGPVDDRKIYWYWEPTGNVGKTAFAHHVCVNDRTAIYIDDGKSADIKHLITSMPVKPRTVIIDIPRDMEGCVSFSAVEAIKNGIFFSGKFESSMCIFDTPHIIIFANCEPDTSRLSKDRWVIKKI